MLSFKNLSFMQRSQFQLSTQNLTSCLPVVLAKALAGACIPGSIPDSRKKVEKKMAVDLFPEAMALESLDGQGEDKSS